MKGNEGESCSIMHRNFKLNRHTLACLTSPQFPSPVMAHRTLISLGYYPSYHVSTIVISAPWAQSTRSEDAPTQKREKEAGAGV